jgi:uncharacterized protein involved in response to NO
MDDLREKLPLSKSAEFLLDECRMVLPGIQALLGFQLIVVFSPGFDTKLGPLEQRLHLVAIALVAVAVAIIMTPAAYSRQTEPRAVTEQFIRISTRLLILSMLPLAAAISLDFYLIAGIIVPAAAAILAALLFLVFFALWFVLPRVRALQRLLIRDD